MYTLDNLLAVLDRIIPLATAASTAGEESKSAKEHAAEVKGAVRTLTAQAVAMGFLMSLGRKSLKAFIGERIPDSPRKAVNISEIFRVLDTITEPVVLAKKWAEGDFSTLTVADALKLVKPAPDALKALEKAVGKALDAGESEEAVLEVVTAATAKHEAARYAAELLAAGKEEVAQAA